MVNIKELNIKKKYFNNKKQKELAKSNSLSFKENEVNSFNSQNKSQPFGAQKKGKQSVIKTSKSLKPTKSFRALKIKVDQQRGALLKGFSLGSFYLNHQSLCRLYIVNTFLESLLRCLTKKGNKSAAFNILEKALAYLTLFLKKTKNIAYFLKPLTFNRVKLKKPPLKSSKVLNILSLFSSFPLKKRRMLYAKRLLKITIKKRFRKRLRLMLYKRRVSQKGKTQEIAFLSSFLTKVKKKRLLKKRVITRVRKSSKLLTSGDGGKLMHSFKKHKGSPNNHKVFSKFKKSSVREKALSCKKGDTIVRKRNKKSTSISNQAIADYKTKKRRFVKKLFNKRIKRKTKILLFKRQALFMFLLKIIKQTFLTVRIRKLKLGFKELNIPSKTTFPNNLVFVCKLLVEGAASNKSKAPFSKKLALEFLKVFFGIGLCNSKIREIEELVEANYYLSGYHWFY